MTAFLNIDLIINQYLVAMEISLKNGNKPRGISLCDPIRVRDFGQ